jgi:hypothetical protein
MWWQPIALPLRQISVLSDVIASVDRRCLVESQTADDGYGGSAVRLDQSDRLGITNPTLVHLPGSVASCRAEGTAVR